MRHARWKCPKCGQQEFETGELRASSGGLASFLDVEDARFTTVTCTRCSFTELYRTTASSLDSVFDLMVG